MMLERRCRACGARAVVMLQARGSQAGGTPAIMGMCHMACKGGCGLGSGGGTTGWACGTGQWEWAGAGCM